MRGDIVTIAMPGDFGKPRPALIIQANQFNAHSSVTVLLLTSTNVQAPLLRVSVQPSDNNGLRKPSQVMIDKIMTIKRERLGPAIGRLDSDIMIEIERRVAMFLGITK